MRDENAFPMLTVHLWDLRAQLEAQLRCLTKVHRWVDELPGPSAAERRTRKDEIIQNLTEIRDTAGTVRDAAVSAMVSAEETL